MYGPQQRLTRLYTERAIAAATIGKRLVPIRWRRRMVVKYLVVYRSQEVALPLSTYGEAWRLVVERDGVYEGKLREGWTINRVAG